FSPFANLERARVHMADQRIAVRQFERDAKKFALAREHHAGGTMQTAVALRREPGRNQIAFDAHRRAPRWPWKSSINRGDSVFGAMLSVRSDPMPVIIGMMSFQALALRPKRFSKQAMHRLSFQPRPNFFSQSSGVAMYQLPVRSTSTPQSLHSGL